MADDIDKIRKLLEGNADKLFVKRILNPFQYPVLNLGARDFRGYPQSGTHLMSWGGFDGKYYAYPTILYDEDSQTLTNYGMDRGQREAMDRGEFIEFDTPQEADWFSKNYKLIWPEDMR